MKKHIVNINDRFGKLIVIKKLKRNKRNEQLWECKCDCGNLHIAKTYNLSIGKVRSCGCIGTSNGQIPHNSKDYTGQKFGRWTVLKLEKKEGPPYYKKYYLCKCDCGNEKVICGNTLKTKGSQSCGCLHKEIASINGKKAKYYCRKKWGESSFKKLINSYKSGAKKRNLEFSLSEENFRRLTKQNCFYCGCPPLKKRTGKNYYGHYIYNGIDRLDNNQGYTIENCVSCCSICNQMKKNYSLYFFKIQIERIYKCLMKQSLQEYEI